MTSLNCAIVGLGRMGWRRNIAVPSHLSKFMEPLAHVDAINIHPRLKLIASSEINSTIAHDFQRINSIPAYSSHREMLLNHDIDLLTIATRTPPKFGIICDALKHNVKGIHCEKPLAQSVEQALKIKNLLDSYNVTLTTGAFRRYTGIYKIFKDLAYSDFLGPVDSFTISFGSGPMFWLHSHSFDLALFLASDQLPESVRSYYLDETINLNGSNIIDSDPVHIFSRITFRDIEINIVPIRGFEVTAFCKEGYIKIVRDGSALSYAQRLDGSPCYMQEVPYVAKKEESNIMNAYCGTASALHFLLNCFDENSSSTVSVNSYLLMMLSLQTFLEQKTLAWNSLDTSLIVTGKSPDGFFA